MSDDAMPPAIRQGMNPGIVGSSSGVNIPTPAVIDPDARDEGIEFETDMRVVMVPTSGAASSSSPSSLSSSADPPAEGAPAISGSGSGSGAGAVLKPQVISGFVHDVGPDTRATTHAALGGCELVIVWGPPGSVEAGPAQAGTRELVKTLCKTPPADVSAAADADQQLPPEGKSLSQHTILVGECTVEWAARICDPAGELGGEACLVKYGRFSCCVRRGAWLTRLLSALGDGSGTKLLSAGVAVEALATTEALVGTAGLGKREPLEEEWAVVSVPRAKAEVGEEEEEEEDEDED